MNVVNILLFILFFGLMLFLHEFGHFIVAKLFGIKVDEFGFGYPPRMIKLFKAGETEFTLNWIPFGAFVKLSGEEDPSVPGGFSSAAPWKRILVLLAGPAMNLLTGVVLFIIMFNIIGIPDPTRVVITDVVKDSPASQAGLLSGDVVTEVNGSPISSMDQLVESISVNKGKEISISVLRDGSNMTVYATPRVNPPPNEGSLGIGMSNPFTEANIIQSIPYALQSTGQQMKAIIQMPYQLIAGKVPAEDARVVGPIGIYSMFNSAREMDNENAGSKNAFDQTFTLRFMIIITIALGLTNLFPIPALDGGRILFILPELLFGKRVPPKYENAVHMIGFILLLALMFYITAQDILNPIQIPK
ncbi:MAG TPA: M50 family metallopeptidase [Bellilinea sp.]|nr:M50 family metallopeptidase [Bellilinea sp.]